MTKRICGTGLPRLLKRNQSSRGQALIEFSLVALTFFILVFALIDFSWLFFNQMMMQNAVREAARYASTGDQGRYQREHDALAHRLDQTDTK